MYQVLAYAVYIALLIGTITLMSKWVDITPTQHRYQSLDGMRGVCAALVVVVHTCSITGIRTATTVDLFYFTAAIAVGLFFMLSGFLFFKKALSDNLNIPRFFIGRIKRIYIPVVVVLLFIYLIAYLIGPLPTGNVLLNFIKDIPFIYYRYQHGDIVTGHATIGVNVFWTLVWESWLYCLIPLLYWLLKPFSLTQKRWAVIVCMILVHCVNAYLYRSVNLGIIMYFLGGFLVATIQTEKKVPSLVGVLLLVAALYFTRYPFHTTTALYFTVVFYTLKCGCDFFGVLTSRPILLLGVCSFPVYITHMAIKHISVYYLYDINHYLYAATVFVVTGIIASLFHHYIERRCMS